MSVHLKVVRNALCFFTAVVLLGLPQVSIGQVLRGFGKKLEKKVEQQINRRVERQADKAINKGFDKVEGAAEDAVKSGAKGKQGKSDSEANAERTTAGLSKGGGNVAIADVYDFNLDIVYQMKSGKDKPVEMEMWFGGKDYVGMSVPMQKDMFMVMHDANMIAFMEKDKRYMVMGGDMMGGIMGAAIEESKDDVNAGKFSIKRIGTERVLNYNCDVYEAKSEEYVTKIWLTTALGVDAGHFMSAFAQLAKSSKSAFPNLNGEAGGVLLKMEGKSLKNKDSMHMEATAVNKRDKRINTKEYKNFSF